VFEYDCELDTFRLGEFIAMVAKQKVESTSIDSAIGRVAKRYPEQTSNVLVDVRSSIMTNGVIA
jgi:hypothetical protein